MTTVKKVAIAGASGNLGPHIVEELLKAGFEVTVLSRKSSAKPAPAGTKSVPVDFEDQESLVAAVTGQDAVVSTMHPSGFDGQKALVEACITAGVKRYIPSDYGMDLDVPSIRKLPVYGYKVKMQDFLESKTDTGLTWTAVRNNAFLEMAIENGSWVDPANKKVTLYEGDKLIGGTTYAGVGKAVAGVLKHLEETKNRAVRVQEVVTSQNELIALTKKNDPSLEYTINKQDIDELEEKAWTAFKGGDMGVLMSFLTIGTWGKDCPGTFTKTDNELLGVKQFSEQELQDLLAKIVKQG